jgi:hypothetical protein
MIRRVAAVALVLSLGACSQSPPTAPTSRDMTSREPSPTVSAAPPSPAPAPSIAAHRFGESVQLGTLAVTTVYGYKQPVAAGAPRPDQAGYTWAAADVKVCAGTGAGTGQAGITVSNDPWSLVYADSSLVKASNTGYNQFPQPGYPFGDHVLNWGRCVRGWITFPVPPDKRPVMVEYQPGPGSAVEGMTVDWSVP